MAEGDRTEEDEGVPAFDEDRPDRPSDDDQQISVSGDRPLAAHDRVTVAEQLAEESLNTRIAREEPEVDAEFVLEEEDPVAGRLVEETVDGVDVTRELEADDTDDHAGLSAEEAAVRVYRADEVMPDEPSTDEAEGRGADRGV